MTTLIPENNMPNNQGKQSIVDDFMYGSNVAGSHMYIRMGFLRKVYGILTAQLLLTTAVGALFMSSDTIIKFVQGSQWMLVLSFILCMGLIFALHIKSRETPTNYILLACFTLAQAYTVGVVVTFYSVQAVIEAFALTCAVTLALTVYTLQSKRDFSSWGAGLFSALWVLILTGLLQIVFQSELLDRAMAAGGAILFSLFIIFDTHMIMHRVNAEEYIIAAINLYLDIINLFLHILRIIGEAQRK